LKEPPELKSSQREEVRMSSKREMTALEHENVRGEAKLVRSETGRAEEKR
jgi:hypothetical protein